MSKENQNTKLIRSIYSNQSFDHVFRWILVGGLICLLFVMMYDYGYVSFLLENDISGVSKAIITIFGISSIYCFWYILLNSIELNKVEALSDILNSGDRNKENVFQFQKLQIIEDLIQLNLNNKGSSCRLLVEAYSSQKRGPVKFGIFLSDTLYKLGLLGTVIGFILMLVSMRDLGEFDVETMRVALQEMTGGMAVALLTTISGLVFGILLRIQFNILDSLILKIIRKLVRFSEIDYSQIKLETN